ncbi:MAG: mandelate racemase [Chloroflexi bacterium]|nr:mandelate racemase [Chloroflexota bacterium]
MPKITGIQTIRTRANGTWLFVKILTDQPGLYGIGSVSDHFRAPVMQAAIENLAPRLIGRDTSRIEDVWRSIHFSAYWRNDALSNTAQAGIDMALWDILGKEAGMPVYRLLGGKVRSAVLAYAHAAGNDLAELEDDVRRYMAEGYSVIRCQLGPYGGGGFLKGTAAGFPQHHWPQDAAFDDEAYLDAVPRMFEYLRNKIGFEPKLTHDVHEHLMPHNAVHLAKRLEPYRLFFLEDLLQPEQVGWYRQVRQACVTPQAMGELFTNPHEYLPLLAERLIDFIRVRVSKGGGITQCRKIAAVCEMFGVRTAWQEGGDNDPVNQMAAVHLDLASPSFGVQEENHFAPEEYDLFPGHARLEGGYLYANDTPGLGIDIDEVKARTLLNPELASRSYLYPEDRRRDGELVAP